MKKTFTISALLLILAATAFADIAIDDEMNEPGKAIDTMLHIRLDRNAKEPRLVIPKDQLRNLRAELEALGDDGSDAAAAVTGVTRTQTIVSGVLLSLAFVVGGAWFLRSGRKPARPAAFLMIGGSVLAGGAFASIVFANAGPPPETRGITTKLFSEPIQNAKFASGRIKLEVSTTETNLLLIVPDTENKSAE